MSIGHGLGDSRAPQPSSSLLERMHNAENKVSDLETTLASLRDRVIEIELQLFGTPRVEASKR